LRWIDAGVPEGDPRGAPPSQPPPVPRLSRVDVTLKMPEVRPGDQLYVECHWDNSAER